MQVFPGLNRPTHRLHNRWRIPCCQAGETCPGCDSIGDVPRCVTCGQRWEGTHAHCPRGATPTDAPTSGRGRLPPSLGLTGYQLEHEVARGGFGTLYSARRESDGLHVAIKVAHADMALARTQLAREVE